MVNQPAEDAITGAIGFCCALVYQVVEGFLDLLPKAVSVQLALCEIVPDPRVYGRRGVERPGGLLVHPRKRGS